MNFDELLAQLGDQWQGIKLYSVENREMMTHETVIMYFFNLEDAIQEAEHQWASLPNQTERDYCEISVHSGEIDQSGDSYRFIVHQKLFKAYKKIYVTQDFADRYKTAQIEKYKASGLTEEDSILSAKNDFNTNYTIQPTVKFGMFAGYNYAPEVK